MSKSGKIALIVGGILVLIELLLFLQYLLEKETTVFPKAPIPVEYPIVNYNNSVKGHDERESIVGVFDGKDRDSLYVIPADEIGFGEDEDMQVLWDVKSANGSVPSLRVLGFARCWYSKVTWMGMGRTSSASLTLGLRQHSGDMRYTPSITGNGGGSSLGSVRQSHLGHRGKSLSNLVIARGRSRWYSRTSTLP